MVIPDKRIPSYPQLIFLPPPLNASQDIKEEAQVGVSSIADILL